MDRLYILPETPLPIAETFPRAAVEVDWNNDGAFDDPYDSLEADTDQLEYVVGKDKASQLVSTAVAGKASVHMINVEGRYSRFNAASPIFGQMLPRRKMKISMLAPIAGVLWTGWTAAAPKAAATVGGVPTATLEGIGALGLLANPNLKINPPPLHFVKTGVAVNAVLDAVGWPAANRIIDAGDMYVGDWFPEDIGALEALQQLADLEGGIIREGKNWDIVFESRYHRQADAASIASQGTFTDALGAVLGYDELGVGEEQVYNRAEVTVTQFRQDAVASQLWLLNPITLGPGETRIIIAQYPADVAFADAGLTHNMAINPPTFPGVVTITPTIRARRVEYALTNTHGSIGVSVTLQLVGRAFRQVTQFLVRKEDLTSQSKYQLSMYPFPSPWHWNEAYASAQAEWVIETYKEPSPTLRLGFPAGDDVMLAQVVAREMSDRISLVATSWQTQFGISGDFYVENQGFRWAARDMPQFFMDLSQAAADPGFFKFDVGKFDTVGKLAR